jgi:hypothetical protein
MRFCLIRIEQFDDDVSLSFNKSSSFGDLVSAYKNWVVGKPEVTEVLVSEYKQYSTGVVEVLNTWKYLPKQPLIIN